MDPLKQTFREALSLPNGLHDGLSQLQQSIHPDSSRYDQVVMLRARLGQLANRDMLGTASQDQLSAQYNELLMDALTFVRHLRAEDLRKASPPQRLLVICKDEDDRAYMAHYCERFGLEQYELQVVHTYESDPDVDLIVFDNRSLLGKRDKEHGTVYDEAQQQRLKLMEAYILHARAYLLHFGPFCPLINQYRERVHAANSIFALYARIQEMLTFLKEIQIYKPEKP